MDPVKVIIDRAKWMNFDRSGYETRIGPDDTKLTRNNSMLYNPYLDTYCCLGFAAIACGFDKEEISQVPTPISLSQTLYPLPEQLGLRDRYLKVLCYEHTAIASKLMNANDTKMSGEAEKRIIKLGKEAGFEFEFTGEYPWSQLK